MQRALSLPPTRVAVALTAGIAAVFGSYGTVGYAPKFVVMPIADLVVRYTPDLIVRYSILYLRDLSHHLVLVTAVFLTMLLFATTTGAGIVIGRRHKSRLARAVVAVGLSGMIAVGLTPESPMSVLGVCGGVTVVLLTNRLITRKTACNTKNQPDATRRSILGSVSSTLALGALSMLSRKFGFNKRNDRPDGQDMGAVSEDPIVSKRLATADAHSLDVEGLDPLVSEQFYQVDINQVDPDPKRSSWTFSVSGAVENEREYTFAELEGLSTERRFVTLRCVSDWLSTDKVDNALWTGTPIDEIIDAVAPEGAYVMARGVDDYYVGFPLDALRGGLLAYGMNGEPLPSPHGSPVRLLVPGHWGEVNVKWITELEFLNEAVDGYWERRGWHGTGPVHTVAKLGAINRLDDGRLEIGGSAYAGTRGVERVDVSIDGGATWVDAELSEPLPGDDVWRQWVHRYETPDEPHEVVVRAIDGTGITQPSEFSKPYPSGATGWVRQIIRP